MNVDRLNWLILTELQKNARVPLKEIAKKVGLSSPAVSERIQKMEDYGIIKGYHTKIDLEQIGYPLCVVISIKIRFGQVERFIDYIKTVPEIATCTKLTGEDCMQMQGFVKNPKHLEELNMRLVKYGELKTSLVLAEIIENKVYTSEF